MKKSLRKPENWQDFENLCKKLWGEIWQVSGKIKKNGRLGQAQFGVDVYAIPNGETEYWGVQCKGKDEYTHAKLTTEEIYNEIQKASGFQPKLKVFIIATTANKDALIEEYVRQKDVESRTKGGFEILLFCWEDIVDLIEENRDTFNFYVNQQNYKDEFAFQVHLDDFKKEKIIKPKCIRKIRRYGLREDAEKIREIEERTKSSAFFKTIEKANSMARIMEGIKLPSFDNKNYALCRFEIIMENVGNRVIEDWRFILTVKDEFTRITDTVGIGPSGLIDIHAAIHSPTHCEGNKIIYRPKEGKPLVQKDNRYFKAWIEPLAQEYDITLEWELIARDFHAKGNLTLIVQPILEDEFEFVEVESKEEIREREILFIKAKKNYPKE